MTDTLIRTAARNIDEYLTGTWRNQLGSELRLVADGDGGLRGGFRNAAGVAEDYHDVVGTYDPTPHHDINVLAFVVKWQAAHSVTAWSGRLHTQDGTIAATWVMASGTAPCDEWRGSFIGHDVFRRGCVETEEVTSP